MLGEIHRDEVGGKITLIRTEKSRFSYLPRPVRYNYDHKTPSEIPSLQGERRPQTTECNRRRDRDLTSDEHTPGTILDSKVFHSSLNVSHIRSRICSFDNILHQPQSSNKKIFRDSPSYAHIQATVISPCVSLSKIEKPDKIFYQKLDYSHVGPLIVFRDNELHTPGGGNITIPIQRLDFRDTAKPKIDVKSSYIPKQSDVCIPNQKLNFIEMATSRIDSHRKLELRESPKNTRHLIDLLTMSLPDLRTKKDASAELPDHLRISTRPPAPIDSSLSEDCRVKDDSIL